VVLVWARSAWLSALITARGTLSKVVSMPEAADTIKRLTDAGRSEA